MTPSFAQSQKIAEEALVMFRSNAMISKDFIVCRKKRSEWWVWRLLRVGNNLEEDLDVF